MNWAAIIWLLLLVAFLAVEASTVTLVSLWFAAGALVAMLFSFMGVALWLQIAVFLVVSTVLLTLLRPLARKYLTPKLTKTNVDSVIGSVGRVTATIDNVSAEGQVSWEPCTGPPEAPKGRQSLRVLWSRLTGSKV